MALGWHLGTWILEGFARFCYKNGSLRLCHGHTRYSLLNTRFPATRFRVHACVTSHQPPRRPWVLRLQQASLVDGASRVQAQGGLRDPPTRQRCSGVLNTSTAQTWRTYATSRAWRNSQMKSNRNSRILSIYYLCFENNLFHSMLM